MNKRILAILILLALHGAVAPNPNTFFDTTSFIDVYNGTTAFSNPRISKGVLRGQSVYVYTLDTVITSTSMRVGVSIYISTPTDLAQAALTYDPIFLQNVIQLQTPTFSSSDFAVFYRDVNQAYRVQFITTNNTAVVLSGNAMLLTNNTGIKDVVPHQVGLNEYLVFARFVTSVQVYKVHAMGTITELYTLQKTYDEIHVAKVNNNCFVQMGVVGGSFTTDVNILNATALVKANEEFITQPELVSATMAYNPQQDRIVVTAGTMYQTELLSFTCQGELTKLPHNIQLSFMASEPIPIGVGNSMISPFIFIQSFAGRNISFYANENASNPMIDTMDGILSFDAMFDAKECQMVVALSTTPSNIQRLGFFKPDFGAFTCSPPTLPPTPPFLPPTPTFSPSDSPVQFSPTTISPTFGSPTIVPTSTAPVPNIKPRLDCIEDEGNGMYAAYLGWDTPDRNVNVPYGQNNEIMPRPPDISAVPSLFPATAAFFPSNEVWRFPFNGQETTWTLGQGVITFSSASEQCITNEANVSVVVNEPFPVSDNVLQGIRREIAQGVGVPLDLTKVTQMPKSTKRQASTTVVVTVTQSTGVDPNTVVGDFIDNSSSVQTTTNNISTNVNVDVTLITTDEPPTVTRANDRFSPTSTPSSQPATPSDCLRTSLSVMLKLALLIDCVLLVVQCW